MTWRPPVRRSALLVVLFVTLSSPAFAREPKPLNDTDESFARAVSKRMVRLNVTSVEPVTTTKDGAELYIEPVAERADAFRLERWANRNRERIKRPDPSACRLNG
jgi:hypothetical protein